MVYFTDIGIGDPSQLFQVVVDISSPNTFVTSVRCAYCAPGDGRYDSSASSSFHPNGTAISIDYGWVLVSGNVSQDTFRLANVEIKNQIFVDANHVEPVGMSWDNMNIVHGILGLTPSGADSSLNIPSPLMIIASQGTLDENVFSLRLREPRQLTFGGVNPNLFTGDIIRLPAINKTLSYDLTGRWQAEANYIVIGSTPGVRLDLKGLTASFSTLTASIMLPDLLVYSLLRDLEFEEIMFMPPSVACERQAYLPDITFNLAGHNFTLTPYDYTFEWPMKGSRVRCASAIIPTGLPPDQIHEIFLGSAFLHTFYSVFDLDTNTVGCKFPGSSTFTRA